ncbi:hypothetical protein MKW98_002154 [Papaver atlanticum]|uniref:Uncharacterized protein n=1 Tax=Papaver atlanticum TaxID=357466 RepID=A0AAD4RUB7_9MAGN|nr:hypothetical protein MKW98_002154 [Papaver atlanticum]
MGKGNRLRKLKQSGGGTKKKLLPTVDKEVLSQGQMTDGEVATCEKHVTASEGNDELSEDNNEERWLGDLTLHESKNPGNQDATSDILAKFDNDYFKKLQETITENPGLLTEKGFAERFHFENFLNYYVEV